MSLTIEVGPEVAVKAFQIPDSLPYFLSDKGKFDIKSFI